MTLLELVDIMQKNLEPSNKSTYTSVHFKSKLLENYGDELVIFNEDGKPDIATFKIVSSLDTYKVLWSTKRY